jgi:hypothetical protein
MAQSISSHRPSGDLSGLSRRSVLQLSGGVALLVAVGACARDDATGTGANGDGTLRIAVPSYPSSWDQDFVGFDPVALMLYKNVFPYLIDYGVTTVDGAEISDTENIIPTFAESFEPDAENRVWTLRLRQGVTFASGNELTARILGRAGPSTLLLLGWARGEWPPASSRQQPGLGRISVWDTLAPAIRKAPLCRGGNVSTQTLSRVEELARETWPADAESAVLSSEAEPQWVTVAVVGAVTVATQFGGCQTAINSCVHPGELN